MLGLDVLGNPYGLVHGIGEGVRDLFYEPYQVNMYYSTKHSHIHIIRVNVHLQIIMTNNVTLYVAEVYCLCFVPWFNLVFYCYLLFLFVCLLDCLIK